MKGSAEGGVECTCSGSRPATPAPWPRSEESWEGLIASLLKGYTRKTLDKGIRSVLRTSRPSRAASRRGNVCALRGATLTVRFLRELAMLAALAYWGFTVGDGVGGPSSALSRRHRAAPAGEPHHGRRTAWARIMITAPGQPGG
jgi:hypothetical protein